MKTLFLIPAIALLAGCGIVQSDAEYAAALGPCYYDAAQAPLGDGLAAAVAGLMCPKDKGYDKTRAAVAQK